MKHNNGTNVKSLAATRFSPTTWRYLAKIFLFEDGKGAGENYKKITEIQTKIPTKIKSSAKQLNFLIFRAKFVSSEAS